MNRLDLIPDLQYAVLKFLSFGELPSITLLEQLRKRGWEPSKPKFSNLMSRLRTVGLVEQEKRVDDTLGPRISRTFYRISKSGRDAVRQKELFLESLTSRENVLADAGGTA